MWNSRIHERNEYMILFHILFKGPTDDDKNHLFELYYIGRENELYMTFIDKLDGHEEIRQK